MKLKPETSQLTLSNEYTAWCMAKTDFAEKGMTPSNMSGNLRFGQFFLNKHLAAGETCPEIYYETDTDTAYLKLSELIEGQLSIGVGPVDEHEVV